MGYSLWQGDEPEGGTKPFGSITEKGLAALILFFFIFFLFGIFLLLIILFFLLMSSSSLSKKNVLVFLWWNTRNSAGGPLMAASGALGWISWGEEGEGEVGVMIRRKRKRMAAKKLFKFLLKPMRAERLSGFGAFVGVNSERKEKMWTSNGFQLF